MLFTFSVVLNVSLGEVVGLKAFNYEGCFLFEITIDSLIKEDNCNLQWYMNNCYTTKQLSAITSDRTSTYANLYV
jgi:hypothetical protein